MHYTSMPTGPYEMDWIALQVQLLNAKLLPVLLVAVSLLCRFVKDIACNSALIFRSFYWIKMVFFAELLEDG